MMQSKREMAGALLRIGMAYFLWQTFDQWGRLIQPFMMWELKPQPDMYYIGLINTIGNFFVLGGTFIIGHLLDSAGTKFTAICVCVGTGAFMILASQVTTTAIFCIIQIARVFCNFPQIAEAFVGSLHSETDSKGRMRSLIWMGIPHGIALVFGPWLAGQSFALTGYDLRSSYAISGILMILTLLPVILFVVPEPRSNMSMQYATKLPTTQVYTQFLHNKRLLWCLLFRLMIEAPFQAYDQMSRFYFASFLVDNPSDMSWIAIVIGLASLFTNLVLMRPMQRLMTGQHMAIMAQAILAVTYLLLSFVDTYWKLMALLPLQVVGTSIGFAVTSAQIIGSVEAGDIGKAAGLGQSVTLFSAAFTPLLAGYFITQFQFSVLCYVSAVVSLLGIALVHVFGGFMKYSNIDLLPSVEKTA